VPIFFPTTGTNFPLHGEEGCYQSLSPPPPQFRKGLPRTG